MAWAPAYASVAELRSFIQDGGTSNTAELTLAIETASRSVDKACNRQFGLVAASEDRFYTAFYDRYACRWVIEIDDLMTVTGLVINAALTEGVYDKVIDVFTLTPTNSAVIGRPWRKIVVGLASANQPVLHGVQVTAKYGWIAVPDTIKMATLIQAARLFARRAAPFGIAGNPEVGQLRLPDKLDVDLVVSVQPYVRHWGAV
jgi:hypothetical protein